MKTKTRVSRNSRGPCCGTLLSGLEASQIDDHEEEDAFATRDDEEDVDDVEAVNPVEASLWDVDAGDPALLEEDTDDDR